MLKTPGGRRGVRPCGFSLIINRDGLLVCPCERLASCPAGFTCSPKCFTSKADKMHCGHAPAELATGLTNLTLEPPLIHLHTVLFLFLQILPSVTCFQRSSFQATAMFGLLLFVWWEDGKSCKMATVKMTLTSECSSFSFPFFPAINAKIHGGLHRIRYFCIKFSAQKLILNSTATSSPPT